MNEIQHRSPAQVTAQAAAPMPRWALLFLLAVFIVPGLFGHDLWPQDATGFGRMWSMAHGGLSDWLLPNVAGARAPQGGPLPYWFGAILIELLGRWIGEVDAAAAANLLWYPLALLGLWQGVFRLARRDEAQPVAGAFGGEASRRDYARLIADISVLLLIATIGIVWRLHQTQADGATLALVAGIIFATSLIEWNRQAAAALAGACIGALALTQGPLPAAGALAGVLVSFWRGGALESGKSSARAVSAALLVVVSLALPACWPVAAFHWLPAEASGYFDSWGANLAADWPGAESLLWILRTGAWFLWPLWPLAAWAVYAWRSSVQSPHLERPLLLLGGLTLAILFSAPLDERALVGIIPPMVALAAFGATTLRRALDNVIDWFSIAIFSFALFFFWAYYCAMQAGAPKAMAASVMRLAPYFTPRIQWLSVVLALAAAAAWIQIVGWRVRRRPRVLWRGPMLAALGATVVWTSANLLFLPAVDYVYSYRAFAQELAVQLQSRGLGAGCVQAHRIPLAERAIIAYYGRIRFDRDGSPETCRLALHRDNRRSTLDDDPPPGVRGMWELSWEGHRRARPDERWRIWSRAP